MSKTAEQLRAEAAQDRERARESFERCDTDGFLSQWASDLSAQKKDRQAQIVENGGKASFVGLYEGERRVKAKLLSGQYGFYWLVHEDESAIIAQRGKPFLPSGENSRVLKSLGLREAQEWAPAYVFLHGNGTGLSGAASVHVRTGRAGDKWGMDAELIEDEGAS